MSENITPDSEFYPEGFSPENFLPVEDNGTFVAGTNDFFDESQGADIYTERMLRTGLDEYELTDEDLAMLEGEELLEESHLPVLAVIGRPNVGKSSLVNRILGKRLAVVQDTPGVTRDRVSYQASWAERKFILVDTGGWETSVKGLDQQVADQAERAIADADAVLFVVDAMVGMTNTDEALVRVLRKSKKPVILAANKVDSPLQEGDAAALWSLGLGEPHSVSALHGRGSGDLLDTILEVLPETTTVKRHHKDSSLSRVALIGRPNVGKSSLLNQLAGEERVVVNPEAGTTRDPVDEIISVGGKDYVFVDTAGIRRRVHQTRGADFYASLRTQRALDNSDLALALIDASEPLTEQDIRVIQQAIDSGRALVIICNKWDEVDDERRFELGREMDRELVQIRWAPTVNLSAKTGWHTNRLAKAMENSLYSWRRRIPTGKLNSFLHDLTLAHPHPVRSGKQPRILFATQASTCPPRFVFFATGFIEAGYRRFLENKLRETFGFEGTPIQISVRVRERRQRR